MHACMCKLCTYQEEQISMSAISAPGDVRKSDLLSERLVESHSKVTFPREKKEDEHAHM